MTPSNANTYSWLQSARRLLPPPPSLSFFCIQNWESLNSFLGYFDPSPRLSIFKNILTPVRLFGSQDQDYFIDLV